MKKAILSINGNKSMNFLLRTVLSEEHFIITVSDVFQGMKEMKSNQKTDLIIVDIDYQTKESIDFIHHIKTSSLFNKPVIVLASEQNKKALDEAGKAKIDNYFLKPFNPVHLVKHISDAITSVSLY
jgi:DNA-binding response OmpR family regulator